MLTEMMPRRRKKASYSSGEPAREPVCARASSCPAFETPALSATSGLALVERPGRGTGEGRRILQAFDVEQDGVDTRIVGHGLDGVRDVGDRLVAHAQEMADSHRTLAHHHVADDRAALRDQRDPVFRPVEAQSPWVSATGTPSR